MRDKKYNKYTSIPDRFPFIIVAIILVFAVMFISRISTKYPMTFFSGSPATNTNVSYPMLFISPVNDEVFNFVSKNEFVPIEIKSRQIEDLKYKLSMVVNGKDIIKTFDSPPYKYNWKPTKSGKYVLMANLIDSNNNIISGSGDTMFEVKFEYEKETFESDIVPKYMAIADEETSANTLPTIKLQIYEGPTYSASDDICYYRVRAIVTGIPVPSVSFSKDDSSGAWGSLKTQINLTRNAPNYTLTATAKNSSGQSSDSITLNWQ